MVIVDPRLSFKANLQPAQKVVSKPEKTGVELVTKPLNMQAPSVENLKANFLVSFKGKQEDLFNRLKKALVSKDVRDIKANVNISGNTQTIEMSFKNKDEVFMLDFTITFKDGLEKPPVKSPAQVEIYNEETGDIENYELNSEFLSKFLKLIKVG